MFFFKLYLSYRSLLLATPRIWFKDGWQQIKSSCTGWMVPWALTKTGVYWCRSLISQVCLIPDDTSLHKGKTTLFVHWGKVLIGDYHTLDSVRGAEGWIPGTSVSALSILHPTQHLSKFGITLAFFCLIDFYFSIHNNKWLPTINGIIAQPIHFNHKDHIWLFYSF